MHFSRYSEHDHGKLISFMRENGYEPSGQVTGSLYHPLNLVRATLNGKSVVAEFVDEVFMPRTPFLRIALPKVKIRVYDSKIPITKIIRSLRNPRFPYGGSKRALKSKPPFASLIIGDENWIEGERLTARNLIVELAATGILPGEFIPNKELSDLVISRMAEIESDDS